MKKLLTLAFLSALAVFAVAACSSESGGTPDAGGVTTEMTEKYFGMVVGSHDYSGQYADKTPANYTVKIAVDENMFPGERTLKRTWSAGAGPLYDEWFKADGGKLWYLQYRYVDNQTAKDTVVTLTPRVLYGTDPWHDYDPAIKTDSTGGSYTYQIMALEKVYVNAGEFDTFKVHCGEPGHNSVYYLAPDTGTVKFEISNNPKMGSFIVGMDN
jgi:hypothetical protein